MVLKQIFDYVMAFTLCVILFVPMMVFFILASFSSGQNGLFVQVRVGKDGRLFNIYKFRSLKGDYDNPITTEHTHQVTNVGRWMIRYKIDELPQLFNILNGTMSFVGPRPDVPGYADVLNEEDRVILSVKPGITGPAQLKYKDEAKILKRVKDPKKYNDEILWPDKVKINIDYVKNRSFLGDLKILCNTVF